MPLSSTSKRPPDGTVTFAWQEVTPPEEGEVQLLQSSARSPEGGWGSGTPTLVDYSPGSLANVALTDNAAGVTALSWSRRVDLPWSTSRWRYAPRPTTYFDHPSRPLRRRAGRAMTSPWSSTTQGG